ncbi:protease modulator HflC [Desulfobacter latus]|uniref:Protein HflC n=1 Tax=Desulfobacter latus TaxID=2292 RepID=A0A850T2V4_9BACT|nr:protease modulator HflC [Desulfobacter latus]NWH06690.1 protease modulator HflC [Desulfobacter latus]
MESTNKNMGSVNVVLMAVAVIAAVVLYNSAYVIDETEQVVITQFGRIVGDAKKTSGLKFKMPFIQKVNYFPKNLLEWDGDPGQIPTKDKKYIWVDTFARWRISDPIVYFQTVKDEFSGLKRLDDIIDPAMRDLISAYPLVESVRNTDRPMDTFEAIQGQQEATEGEETPKRAVRYRVDLGRTEIARQIEKQAREKLADFGIQVVDVKIKRINYIDSVRSSVYGRMIAERNQIAEKFRAEGQGEASNIRGEKERDLQVIKSQAYKQAQEIKGNADAEATRIYAAAYGQDPEFYAFVKTMELYKNTLEKDSTVILSTDSDLMKYFKKSSD